jgi:hypothetical protein
MRLQVFFRYFSIQAFVEESVKELELFIFGSFVNNGNEVKKHFKIDGSCYQTTVFDHLKKLISDLSTLHFGHSEVFKELFLANNVVFT